MAIKAISAISADWWTPKCERDETDPTQFNIRPLDGMQYMEVMNEVNESSNGDLQVSGLGLKLAVKYGLKGWRNFSDPDSGQAIKFSSNAYGRIPTTILQEMVGEIIERSDMGEEDQKN